MTVLNPEESAADLLFSSHIIFIRSEVVEVVELS